MGSFSAVTTTGIYCRPGCGARPSPANVTSYPLAASAEAAGYRACFQCRPYRWPDTVSWGVPELVCRGVRLILAGALDGATEECLGARLGVSARHLRRLFVAHLGVTPDGLARSARAHLARRLLDDTDLSVLEIALATGFGSVRQFNRACKEIFRASPRDLRAKRRKGDRLVADGGLPLRLAFRGALDWPALVAYLGAHAIPGVEHVGEDLYRRTIVVDGHPGVLELSRGGEDHLVVVAHLPRWGGLLHLVARVRRIASLDVDLEEPERHLAGDATIGPLLRAFPGLRPPGTWDPVETGVHAIVAEQAGTEAARSVTGRIVDRLGDRVFGLSELGLTHTFPPASELAFADLRGLGLSRAGQAAVRSFARAVSEDAVRLDGSVGLDELLAALTAIRGLGTASAHDIALRMGEPDAFPAASLGSGRQLVAAPASWRPWRAFAFVQLWHAERRSRRVAPPRAA